MSIRTKKDVQNLLSDFSNTMAFDMNGKKHYFVFKDLERNGQWTLMQYADGLFTLHGRGHDYCDQGEQVLQEHELVLFLWKNRKLVNESLKQMMQLV